MKPHRLTRGFVALAAFTTFLHCSNKRTTSEASESACPTSQALQATGIRGSSMPPMSIALTFDDGPGPRTKQLSLFLKNEGIRAAFFVNGRVIVSDANEILQALVDDGHLVANHTETHRSLTGVSTETERLANAEIVQEIMDTDAKIEAFVPAQRFLFRPPFGDYDERTFDALIETPMNKYVGPILWDIGDRMDEEAGRAADWDCWQDGTDGRRLTMEACGDLYLTEIRRANRGIVLLHDPYFNEQDLELRGTVDMVMYMVPILKREGYTFVRVDEVPEIAALLPPLPPEIRDEGKDEPEPMPEDEASAEPEAPPCP